MGFGDGGRNLTAVLIAVARLGYWRVKLAWPSSIPRYFGRFDTQAEAEKWIEQHRWLTEQPQTPDVAPTAKVQFNDR
jgi:hypothetical protein